MGREHAAAPARQAASRLARLLLIAILCGGGAVACGYHFQGKAQLPGGAQFLYVDIFENRTNQPGLETTVTNAVVFEFIKRSKQSMVSDRESADLIMKGVIRSVELSTDVARYRDSAGARGVSLTLDVQLVTPAGKVEWSAVGLTDTESYTVPADKFLSQDKQRATLGIVATRIAEKIYNRFTDNF
jgi:outer membrane lipopolysaccharide assembly protein LptE/RlpB